MLFYNDIMSENSFLFEARSSVQGALEIISFWYEAPAPAAAKPMALAPAMRAGMSAASGKIPPFCVLRLLFRVLHLRFVVRFFVVPCCFSVKMIDE